MPRELDYRTKTMRARTWISARTKATKQCPKTRTVVSVLELPSKGKVKGLKAYQIGSRKKLK